jgi:hypothetical protein
MQTKQNLREVALSEGPAATLQQFNNEVNGRIAVCQRKVEMSSSLQSRNVLFGWAIREKDGKLWLPATRRRALLASNPIKE